MAFDPSCPAREKRNTAVANEDARILVVDDEPAVMEFLTRTLRAPSRRVRGCLNAGAALESARKEKPDLLIADLGLPGMDGIELSCRLKAEDPDLEVILITGDAIDWQRPQSMGAFDWVAKPFQGPRLRWVADQALERHRLRRENRLLAAELALTPPPVVAGARTAACRHAVNQAHRFALSSENLMWISGEIGVGKRSLSRWIHDCGVSASEPLLQVDAKSVPVERIETLQAGTLVLTDAESLSLAAGESLLRRMNERSPNKLGSGPKIIFLTKDSELPWGKAGSLLRGLALWLESNHIAIPPLRQRQEDLFPLLAFWLRDGARKQNQAMPKIELPALRLLEHYAWPENAGEVRWVMQDALALSRERSEIAISGDTVRTVLEKRSRTWFDLSQPPSQTLEALERQVMLATLQANAGDKGATARQLGISLRTLYRKLKREASLPAD